MYSVTERTNRGSSKIVFPDMMIVFVSAVLINGFMTFILLNFFDSNIHPDYYHTLASNLLDGKGYVIGHVDAPVTWRPPLYPIFLFFIYSLFGVSHIAVVCVHVLLNSLTSLLIFKIANRVFGHPVGLFSAIAYAFYPLSAYYLVSTLPMTLFSCLLYLFILVGYKLYDHPSLLTSFLFGMLQGALTLCKLFFKGFPVYFLLCFLAVYMISSYRSKQKSTGEWIKRHIVLGAMMFLGFSIVLLPWCVRNYKVLDVFPVVGVGGGFTLWIGNNTYFDGLDSDQLPDDQRLEMTKQLRAIIGTGTVVDYDNDSKLYDEAIKNFVRFPGESAILMVKKIYRLWFSVYNIEMRKYQWIVISIQSMLLIPGILGLLLALRKRVKVLPLLLLMAYFQIVYTLFLTTVRYSVPIMPIFICFAVYFIVEVRKKRFNIRNCRKI